MSDYWYGFLSALGCMVLIYILFCVLMMFLELRNDRKLSEKKKHYHKNGESDKC